MAIHFTVGDRRNWLTLWKPTIDALGQILGYPSSTAEWSPRDGRIVELAQHRHVHRTLGATVHLTVSANLDTFV